MSIVLGISKKQSKAWLKQKNTGLSKIGFWQHELILYLNTGKQETLEEGGHMKLCFERIQG